MRDQATELTRRDTAIVRAISSAIRSRYCAVPSTKPFFVCKYTRLARVCMLSLDIHFSLTFLLVIQDGFLKLHGIAVTHGEVKVVPPKVTYFPVVTWVSEEVESCAMILLYSWRIPRIYLNSSRVTNLQPTTALEVNMYSPTHLFQSLGDESSCC